MRTSTRKLFTVQEDGKLTEVHALWTEFTRVGSQTFSGDGVETDFTFPHHLPAAPNVVLIGPMTDHAAEFNWHWSATATDITIHFVTAPQSGTDNVVFCFLAMV